MPGHQARYPASYKRRLVKGPAIQPRFPAAFRPSAFAFWASCPARELRPLTIGLLRHHRRGPGQGSVFRMHGTSWDGRPLYPGGGGVHTTVPRSAVAACRFPVASPFHPGLATRPGELGITGHRQGFTGVRPSSLPLTCGTLGGTGALGLSPEAPHPAGRTHRRTSRAGTGLNTEQRSRPRHQRTSTDRLTHHVRPHVATSPPMVLLAVTASRAPSGCRSRDSATPAP